MLSLVVSIILFIAGIVILFLANKKDFETDADGFLFIFPGLIGSVGGIVLFILSLGSILA